MLTKITAKKGSFREKYIADYKRKLKKRFGEYAYTISEISSALIYLGFDNYARELHFVAPITFSGALNRNPLRQREGFPFILRSNIQRTIDRLALPIDAEDLELTAKHLRYNV